VVCHSLGCRMVAVTLARAAPAAGALARRVIFLAPDVDVAQFLDDWPAIRRNLAPHAGEPAAWIYGNRNDSALGTSAWLHGGGARVGQLPPSVRQYEADWSLIEFVGHSD